MTAETYSDAGQEAAQGTRQPRKLGLALSGGGFRASFFHIGVLARMAECGLLRHVEVISTVSGGSIIGVLYYLHLKKLLETTADGDIRDQAYVTLVNEVESDFRKAVQKNLRMRTFANPWHNAKMARRNYSRSDRIGELYDKHIYRPAFSKTEDAPIEMRQLKIRPYGDAHKDDFNPTKPGHNDNRSAKVPILRINATTLNTGHNWCFMATYMGEAPPRSEVTSDIDKQTRLRRGSYDEITEQQQAFPLGKAVASSAGVPGLFPPLAVSKLYSGWQVELVDGGVFDNQGIAGLNDPDFPCTDFIVSDASGQSQDDKKPHTSLAAVLSRTMDTLMGRVRDEMVEGLIARHDRDRVAFMHLTRGLVGHDEPFLRADGKPEQAKVRGTATSGTDFGVDPKFQGLLSRIRTDLDSFTDIEAFALEADGYRMSGPELTAIARNFGSEEVVSDSWPFARMGERLSNASDTALSKHLEVASHKLLKPYRVGFSVGLPKALGLIGVSIIALVALVAYLFLIWYLLDLIRPGWLKGLWDFLKGCLLDGDTALGILATIIVGFFSNWVGTAFKAWRILRWPPQFVLNMFTKFILPAFAALPIVIYLLTIDRYFVRVLGR